MIDLVLCCSNDVSVGARLWLQTPAPEGHNTHSNSRGGPQEEHPDGPPLFVCVLGTSLRPGGTQGGVLQPRRSFLHQPCRLTYSDGEGGHNQRPIRWGRAAMRR